MKYLITIPSSLTKGKKPKIIPERHLITEAFNQAQVERRILALKPAPKNAIVMPLDKWIEAIPNL